MDHPLEVVAGVLLVCALWCYVHFVAWHGMRWHLRAAWTGGRTIRAVERGRRRRERAIDGQLRALLDEANRCPADRSEPGAGAAAHDYMLRRRDR